MKDYEYIKNHPEEYMEQYKAAEKEVMDSLGPAAYELPSDVVERSVKMAFHINLIKSKEECVPESCNKCPVLFEIVYNGVKTCYCGIRAETILTTDTKPDWCPLNRYISNEVEDEHNDSEQDLH